VAHGGTRIPPRNRKGGTGHSPPTGARASAPPDGAPAAGNPSPYWNWARLLKRVFAFDLERCPACGRGTLRIIAAITHAEVLRKILRHLQLATDPPPIAPARACHVTLAWTSPSPDSASCRVPRGPVVAEVRPFHVTRNAYGKHERVRDVSRAKRGGFPGQTG
jgi:hypothetical protein